MRRCMSCAGGVLLLVGVLADAQQRAPVTSSSLQQVAFQKLPACDGCLSNTFWRAPAVSGTSLFGALQDFGRRSNDDRLLRSRGVVRPLNFQYRSFRYERDFFHVYNGFRLQSFMDGKLEMGLYKHRFHQGMLFGPASSYRPTNSTRLELILRWNLNDQ